MLMPGKRHNTPPRNAACVQGEVDEQLQRTFSGQPDYRLALFRGDGPEEARNGPGIGWGFLAYKTSHQDRVHHMPFRVSPAGFYVRFDNEPKSTVVRNLALLTWTCTLCSAVELPA